MPGVRQDDRHQGGKRVQPIRAHTTEGSHYLVERSLTVEVGVCGKRSTISGSTQAATTAVPTQDAIALRERVINRAISKPNTFCPSTADAATNTIVSHAAKGKESSLNIRT